MYRVAGFGKYVDTNCPMPLVIHVVAPSASLYLPDGQCEHVLDPASAAYLPTGHAVHVVPSPAYPALQTLHAATDVEPAADVVKPLAQTVHPPAELAPSVAYVLTGHAQSVAAVIFGDVWAAMVPALGQAVHVADFASP